MAELQLKTTAHVGTWHLDEVDWTVDQQTGQIQFTDTKRGMLITAPVQILGTYDTQASTWMWSWANPSIDVSLQHDAKKTQEYGKQKGYSKLTSPKIGCDQQAAWNLAALACMVCGQQGVYRGPAGTTMVFMAFGKVSIRKA